MGVQRSVLWDIDHTLIDTRGVGRELSGLAFERVTGRRMERQAKIDGITEPVIFRETAALHGLTTDRADFERFARALGEAHVQLAPQISASVVTPCPVRPRRWNPWRLCPAGYRPVVTGNVRAVAEIKLQVFGLDRHIRWGLGAYGEDADDRPELVRLALERAELTAEAAVLVDDTPAGVEAGKAHSLQVVGVATGRSSGEDLRRAGADVVLDGPGHHPVPEGTRRIGPVVEARVRVRSRVPRSRMRRMTCR
ncbi:HAD family hydrolase [Streptomyces sp. I05A-00742]|uniref:HAD family hydrolase n=1 Tax=Streptomyces sp. I05A-00742 TaxID=2732853 RepID=UPI001489447F|nr:HAD hydrolase-like protein [Streptomyces sp. I05A-00742]